jgi:hypothetical protein
MNTDIDHPPAAPTDHPAEADPDWLPRWEIVFLGSVDVLLMILFVALGRESHNLTGADRPFIALMNSAIPFGIAWVLAGTGAGNYRGTALYPLRRVILRTLLTGLFAGPLGVGIRAAYLVRPVDLTFLLAATGVSTGMMLVWRIAWSRLRRLWWDELP